MTAFYSHELGDAASLPDAARAYEEALEEIVAKSNERHRQIHDLEEAGLREMATIARHVITSMGQAERTKLDQWLQAQCRRLL